MNKSRTDNNRIMDPKGSECRTCTGPDFWCFHVQGQFEGPNWLGLESDKANGYSMIFTQLCSIVNTTSLPLLRLSA
jgi:hypothetical protein